MKTYIQHVAERKTLSETEATSAFDLIMAGVATPAQIGALLMGLRVRGETVEEIAGAAASMRRHAVFVDPRGLPVVDTCGTGGDGAGSFNISTAAALVVAGAGVPVAKHGNRAITSKCGSADVLAALGVNIEAPADTMEACLHEFGLAFLYAPAMHPAMKHAGAVRRELGTRTIFNLLGPLSNPAGAKCQVLGVFAPELTEMLAEVLRRLGSRRVFVVHGHDGMDEITTTARTRVSELHSGRIKTYDLDPLEFFDELASPADLAGGVPTENAGIIRRILAGEKGPRRNIVCLNAAAGLVAGGKAETLHAGLKLAEAALDSGRVGEVLQKLVRGTNA
ncbi:MAG: anthranilate phosphoribosyltransferase [bacterium]